MACKFHICRVSIGWRFMKELMLGPAFWGLSVDRIPSSFRVLVFSLKAFIWLYEVTHTLEGYLFTQNLLVYTLLLSHSVIANSLQPHGLQHAIFPVLHHLPELAQIHVHWVGEVIQPSHPLSSPSPPAFNLAQHQCLFQLVSSLHQVAKGWEFQLQHQSFQWIFRVDFL